VMRSDAITPWWPCSQIDRPEVFHKPILHFWLAATLLTAVTSFTGGGAANAFTRVNSGSESSIAKDLDSHFGYIIAGGVFGIITTILFIVFVREVAARHMQATREA